MAEPDKPNDAGSDKSKFKQYLVPIGAVAAVVILVGLVIAVSGTSNRKMSDGSDGTAGDSGLKEIAPGVRYRDIKEGSGEACPPGAEVTIHYTGWLESGEVFDSTKENKIPSPSKFKLKSASALPFWSAGIPGMKTGGTRKLVVSKEKGNGGRGSEKVPSGSNLIFEVELIGFTTPKVSGPGQPMPFDNSDGGTDDPDLKDLGGGLKYRDLKEGSGEPVQEGATILVYYTGWLVDGHVFDSSRNRGKPTSFSLAQVVPGWQRGISGMKPGGVRKLVIPAGLGYGDRGKSDIPGGATLIFEVELVR